MHEVRRDTGGCVIDKDEICTFRSKKVCNFLRCCAKPRRLVVRSSKPDSGKFAQKKIRWLSFDLIAQCLLCLQHASRRRTYRAVIEVNHLGIDRPWSGLARKDRTVILEKTTQSVQRTYLAPRAASISRCTAAAGMSSN